MALILEVSDNMKKSFNYQTQRLVRLAKNGDESALGVLFKVHGERVRRRVRMQMGPKIRSRLETMDVVQNVFISALRSLDDFTYQNEGDFLRWLTTIAKNRIRDSLREEDAEKRGGKIKKVPLNNNSTTQSDAIENYGPSHTTTPSFIMSRREDLNKLEKAIDKLKPEYREVIILTKIEELSHKEVAEKLGKSTDAVRMLLSRAIMALSQSFEKIE